MGGPLLATSWSNVSVGLTNFTAAGNLWKFTVPQSWTEHVGGILSIPLTFEVLDEYGLVNNDPSVFYQFDSWFQENLPYAKRLDGILTKRFVDLNVIFTTSSCRVTAIRSRTMTTEDRQSMDTKYFISFFFDRLGQAFPVKHAGSKHHGVLEAYLWDPTKDPYDVLDDSKYGINFTTLRAQPMAQRLSQVINTHRLADNQFINVAGGFDPNSAYLKDGVGFSAARNASVTTMDFADFLHASSPWFAILCTSTLMMSCASIASVFLSFLRLAPEATSFLPALALGNVGSTLEGASYLDEDERFRLLKDERLMIGDSKTDEEVGQIMIGRDGELGALKKSRLYQ